MSLISDEQVPARVEDVVQVLGLLVVDLAEHPLGQHLREADDRVERRAQLVRHVGQELALVPARDLELAALVSISRNSRAFWIASADCVANVFRSSITCGVEGAGASCG